MLLDKINSPDDLKKLNVSQLDELAKEIRKVIIETVSLNGGHLASNLGIVEIAVALHYVFDSPWDKIVWDVGHQSYPHKLLTGRRDKFFTLRQFEGISGFPVITESPHDVFGTGHSSTSISAAFGIREGGCPGKVVAVIGDGALTSGLAFEGLNHAGHRGKDLIVVLNNNDMSISKSTGALAKYLNKMTGKDVYKKEPGGAYYLTSEESRRAFSPGEFFENLGFHYIEAFDGHNINLLLENLRKAKEAGGLVLVHVVTKKGKGYKFSEDDPSTYHGANPFVIDTGYWKKSKEKNPSYSQVFGKTLSEIASENEKIVAITAAMKEGTGLSAFAEKFPKRFYDVGIAEPHAVTFAAGLATQGIRPVVAIYSTFLQRAYDQIIHDVCLQNLPVVFAIDRAGIVGEDGATHHGVFDIPFLRNIPCLSMMAPKDTNELSNMLRFAVLHDGPIALRYPRGSGEPVQGDKKIEFGKGELLRKGDDLLIIGVGSMVHTALKVAEMLKKEGVESSVMNARFINPIDEENIVFLAKKTGRVITIEEGILKGGFGSAVMESLHRNDLSNVKVKLFGVDNCFIKHGSPKELKEKHGLTPQKIYEEAKSFLQK